MLHHRWRDHFYMDIFSCTHLPAGYSASLALDVSPTLINLEVRYVPGNKHVWFLLVFALPSVHPVVPRKTDFLTVKSSRDQWSYCWWNKSGENPPVEGTVGSWNLPLIYRVWNTSKRWLRCDFFSINSIKRKLDHPPGIDAQFIIFRVSSMGI